MNLRLIIALLVVVGFCTSVPEASAMSRSATAGGSPAITAR